MKSLPPSIFLLSLAVSTRLFAIEPALPEKVDFNRDVRPILSDNCFKCHGFDPKTRDGGRRLDTREGALKDIDEVRAVVPGILKESDLHLRVRSTDKDDIMPPPKTGKKLTERQMAILDRWIEQGASYDTHWAFKPPVAGAPPATKIAGWARNAVDQFVLSRLERESLKPSPEADKFTLIRRLSLDLIGLPPTVEETDAFVNDSSSEAYEKLVDRLIASPRYGERWARRWLDLARYADTNGYEKDRPRNIWPYRDWVVNALNAGMPFDQFTVEQLAGDLLPNATEAQRTATGFHRNTMLNEEGGIDPLEFRYLAMTDRVGTTGTAWLGLTVQCAQCHTHKYDPITHREYFQFMAFLNNADEPEMDLPPADAAVEEKARRDRLAVLIGGLPDRWPARDVFSSKEMKTAMIERRYADWLAVERGRAVRWAALRPSAMKTNSPLLTVQPDLSVLASGDIQKTDIFELKFGEVPRGITAIRLEALPDPSLPAHGPGACYYEGPKGDFFLGEFEASVGGERVKFLRATESHWKNNFGKNAANAATAIDGDPQTGWSCADRPGQAHEAVFIPERPIAADSLDLKMVFGRHYACSLGRFRISVTTDTHDAVASGLPDDVQRLLALEESQLTDPDRQRLREQFLLAAPELAVAAQEIRALRQPAVYPTTLVMRERPAAHPRPTFMHHRGEFLQPGEAVEPGLIAALGTFPADAPRNRLGLARWLVSPENPLTARVTVNREWSAFFGRGLVATIADFGFQGETPSHPELLDWLALEFMRDGWSVKRLHKLIVTSATYRQTSRATPELQARDPQNRLLGRGSRFRLEGEMIRDSALRVSGLLSEKMGGPSVRPPQPEGVSETAYGSAKWIADTGENRFRRSLYTFAKRTAPFALYNSFDAPTGEACIAQREVSNTPLQALALLNDVVFLETARALGNALAASPEPLEQRVRIAFQRCLTRPPTEEEATMLTKFFVTQKDRFARGEIDARALAGEGQGDIHERAAWVALARAILNLDEAITRS